MLFGWVGDGFFVEVSCSVSILAVIRSAVVGFILMLSTAKGCVVGLTSEQCTSSKGKKKIISNKSHKKSSVNHELPT